MSLKIFNFLITNIMLRVILKICEKYVFFKKIQITKIIHKIALCSPYFGPPFTPIPSFSGIFKVRKFY
jgi:hypothetical protein